jgi:dCMP deaminase
VRKLRIYVAAFLSSYLLCKVKAKPFKPLLRRTRQMSLYTSIDSYGNTPSVGHEICRSSVADCASPQNSLIDHSPVNASVSLSAIPSKATRDVTDHMPREPLTCQQSISTLLQEEAGYNVTGTDATRKRSEYISWDEYFMAIAALSAMRSKDPNRSTGACLVDASNRVIGTGYNGFPCGCSDDVLPWNASTGTDGDASTPWLHTKSPFEVHAEVNAILNKCAPDCDGARLYTHYFPCNDCAKVIIQSRISEVIYIHNESDSGQVNDLAQRDSICASRILLTMAGVRVRRFHSTRKQLGLALWKALDSNETSWESNQAVGSESPPRTDAAVFKYRDLLIREASYDPVTSTSTKRTTFLSWDDYFMCMAFLSAQRSKDPNTQVGACIVDANKRIVGLGYNGFPAGCSDDFLPWARDGGCELHKKYMYVCHAEVNAILNKGSADVRGSTIYVALFPCNECSKVIIQAGIREVVYMNDRYHDTDSCRASRILFRLAGVALRRHIPKVPSLSIQFDKDEQENVASTGSGR